MGKRTFDPEILRPQKLIISGSKNGPILPFVDQSSPNLVRVYGSDRALQRRFPVDDVLFQSGEIGNKVAKWRGWKLRFSAPKF